MKNGAANIMPCGIIEVILKIAATDRNSKAKYIHTAAQAHSVPNNNDKLLPRYFQLVSTNPILI